MRLLNAHTKELRVFNNSRVPYAILSHTWGEEEVSFQDLISGRGCDLGGYRKIEGASKQAISDGFDYIVRNPKNLKKLRIGLILLVFQWIDTCCIDKTSSSELTEAINSMWNWYKDSQICYAFLEDITSAESDFQFISKHSGRQYSKWFTRGWTLQELIAPQDVVFFTQDWVEIGTRSRKQDVLGTITGIDRHFFTHGILSQYSIAQKMSWAARRETTRIEDRAYSLLGLFDVNMPLLYGEGEMAFVRLQEEIMRRTDDQSIFAWIEPVSRLNTGFFAPSPSCFGQSGSITTISESSARLPPYAFTNQGIQITLQVLSPAMPGFELPFIQVEDEQVSSAANIRFSFSPTGTIAILNCKNAKGWRVGVYMERLTESGPFYRCNHRMGFVSIPDTSVAKASLETVLVGANRMQDAGSLWRKAQSTHFVQVKLSQYGDFHYKVARTSDDRWVHNDPTHSIILSFDPEKQEPDQTHLYFEEDVDPNGIRSPFCIFFRVDSEDTVKSYLEISPNDPVNPSVPDYSLFRHKGVQVERRDLEIGNPEVRLAKEPARYGDIFDVVARSAW